MKNTLKTLGLFTLLFTAVSCLGDDDGDGFSAADLPRVNVTCNYDVSNTPNCDDTNANASATGHFYLTNKLSCANLEANPNQIQNVNKVSGSTSSASCDGTSCSAVITNYQSVNLLILSDILQGDFTVMAFLNKNGSDESISSSDPIFCEDGVNIEDASNVNLDEGDYFDIVI